MYRRHAFWMLLPMLVLFAACGTSGATAEPAPLEPSDQPLVEFEARWLCDVQRYAYTTLADMETARSSLMASFGVAVETYDTFKGRLQSDQGLRHHVAAAFHTVCGSGGA